MLLQVFYKPLRFTINRWMPLCNLAVFKLLLFGVFRKFFALERWIKLSVLHVSTIPNIANFLPSLDHSTCRITIYVLFVLRGILNNHPNYYNMQYSSVRYGSQKSTDIFCFSCVTFLAKSVCHQT